MHPSPHLTDRRLSRRTALRALGLGAAGLAAAALVGCSDDVPEGAPSAGEARGGGAYRASITGVFAGVDPHVSVYAGSGVVGVVYNYLLRQEVARPDIGRQMDLAESVEVGADGLTWTFRLRPDVRIAPNEQGVPERALDAEDVLASFRRMADPATGATAFPFFSQWVASTDAPDERTVRLVTRRPFSWTADVLGDNLQGAIVAREWLERGAEMRTRAVGGGAFRVESLQEGDRAVLRPNPNYYLPDRPLLDEFRIQLFQDTATQRTAFASRQVDTFLTADHEEAAALVDSVAGIVSTRHPSTGFNSFWMNATVAPWTDERVRRAVNLALGRQEYVDLLGKGLGHPMGALMPLFAGYALQADELARLQPFDPAEAAALFAAAEVDAFEFVYPAAFTLPDYASIFVRQMAAAGVAATARPMEPAAWLGQYFSGALSATLAPNQQYKTPEVGLRWYRTGGVGGADAYGHGHYRADIDAALDEAATHFDEAARREAYRDVQRLILASDPAYLNIYNLVNHTLVYDDVAGLRPGPGAMDLFLMRDVRVGA
ncbi:MAG: ABC transporter substrate-binding protein [Chloroflexota bacterium]